MVFGFCLNVQQAYSAKISCTNVQDSAKTYYDKALSATRKESGKDCTISINGSSSSSASSMKPIIDKTFECFRNFYYQQNYERNMPEFIKYKLPYIMSSAGPFTDDVLGQSGQRTVREMLDALQRRTPVQSAPFNYNDHCYTPDQSLLGISPNLVQKIHDNTRQTSEAMISFYNNVPGRAIRNFSNSGFSCSYIEEDDSLMIKVSFIHYGQRTVITTFLYRR